MMRMNMEFFTEYNEVFDALKSIYDEIEKTAASAERYFRYPCSLDRFTYDNSSQIVTMYGTYRDGNFFESEVHKVTIDYLQNVIKGAVKI